MTAKGKMTSEGLPRLGRTARRPSGASLVVLGAAMALLMAVGTDGIPVSATEVAEDSSAGRSTSGLGSREVPMRFTAEEYQLRGEMTWHLGDVQPLAGVIPGEHSFARLQFDSRDNAERSPQFAVEGQTGGYQKCRRSSNCHDVRFGVTNDDDAGRLYLHAPTVDGVGRAGLIANDFTQQAAEISATDTDTGLAVYREVRMEPPEGSPADCDDFPDQDKLRYSCLFMHEILPEEPPETTTQMTRALPNLTQSGSNYNLVFAEEFNGSEPRSAFPCESGVAALDSSIWTINNSCRPDGESCADMSDGYVTIGQYSGCGVELRTDSGFAYKYGYFEVKYTVNTRSIAAWNNYNLLIGHAGLPRRDVYPQYDVEIDSYEDVGKYLGAIIGALEYTPNSGYQIMQTHINHGSVSSNPDVGYRRGLREGRVCNVIWRLELKLRPRGCGAGDEVTITLGIEWTPRGYRHFIQVDGQHDDLETVPSRYEQLMERKPGADWRTYKDAPRGAFLEYLVPGDDESYLWNYAVSHTPMPVHIGAWGWNRGNEFKAWMKIDYMRVFQPDNLYRDMEPVYG